MSPKSLLWPHLHGVSVLGFPSIPDLVGHHPDVPSRGKAQTASKLSAAGAGVCRVDEALPAWPALQRWLLVLLATKMQCAFLGGLNGKAERKSFADLGCFLGKFPF